MAIKVAILGNGLVGSELARMLESDNIFDVVSIGVKNIGDRDSNIFTDDLFSIASNPAIDIVIDALPEIEPSESIIIQSLKNKKIVISCNKKLWDLSGDKAIDAAASSVGIIWLNSLVCNPKNSSVVGQDITDKSIRSFLPDILYAFRGGSYEDAARFLHRDMLKAIGL